MANMNKTKVITGVNTRLSYFHGWEPASINGGEPKYSVSVLIPKTDKETVDAINNAIDAAIEEGITKFGGKKANSKTAPQIVDKAVKPILDRDEVYSGCYGRVSLSFYAFNSNGNKGVACGLGNIQKIKDGDSLGGRPTAVDDFTTLEDNDFLA